MRRAPGCFRVPPQENRELVAGVLKLAGSEACFCLKKQGGGAVGLGLWRFAR